VPAPCVALQRRPSRCGAAAGAPLPGCLTSRAARPRRSCHSPARRSRTARSAGRSSPRAAASLPQPHRHARVLEVVVRWVAEGGRREEGGRVGDHGMEVVVRCAGAGDRRGGGTAAWLRLGRGGGSTGGALSKEIGGGV
jgi:hypothetical protein